MPDVREMILDRLVEIIEGVNAIQSVSRNFTEFDSTHLPAVAVLEGDEEVSEDDLPLGRPSNRPYIVTMLPNVLIRADGSMVGTILNTIRAEIIKAVLSDGSLNAMTVNGRGARYSGLQSTLHAARSMVGASALIFSITYALNPSDL